MADAKIKAPAEKAVAATPVGLVVDGKDVLLSTAGRRLRLLLALVLLIHATIGVTVGIARVCGRRGGAPVGAGETGHWANATGGSESQPPAVVPCAVDLAQLLASADVHIDIDPARIRQQHGCCGDDVCSLGEDFGSCPADCADGLAGTVVWIEPADHAGRRGRGRQRQQRGNRLDDDIDDRDDASRDHHDGSPHEGEQWQQHSNGRRHGGIAGADGSHRDGDTHTSSGGRDEGQGQGERRRGRGRGVEGLIAALISLAVGGLLVRSVWHELGSITTDFCTFFCPAAPACCGGRHHGHVVQVAPPSSTSSIV